MADTLNVRSHIGSRWELNTIYKGVKTFIEQTRFKNLEGKPKRRNPKRIILN